MKLSITAGINLKGKEQTEKVWAYDERKQKWRELDTVNEINELLMKVMKCDRRFRICEREVGVNHIIWWGNNICSDISLIYLFIYLHPYHYHNKTFWCN